MQFLRKLLLVVFFVSIIPITLGLRELSRVATAWGPSAHTMAMAMAAGVVGLLLWAALILWSRHLADKVHRRRQIARANISAAWQRNKARPLDVDLEGLSLGRVPLGGDMQGLSFLGSAEDAERAPEGALDYDSLGLSLEMRDGRLGGFELEVDTFLQSTGAAIHAGGAGAKIRPDMSEAELVAMLGAPFWRAEDAVWATLFFERFVEGRWVELRFEFDETGRLETLAVSDKPTLADAGIRNSLGMPLSRDWPPEEAESRAS